MCLKTDPACRCKWFIVGGLSTCFMGLITMIGAGVNLVSPPYTRTPTPDKLEFRAQKPETRILGNPKPETRNLGG